MRHPSGDVFDPGGGPSALPRREFGADGPPEAVGQRLMDYVCGGVTAMDGRLHRLGEEVFLRAPSDP